MTSPNPSDTDPIVVAPAPWKTKCSSYIIPIWTSGATAANLPEKAYSPLEARSPYASEAFGKPQRSMGMIQLVRYTDTPAGPYEEMVLVPGRFSYPIEDKDGKIKSNMSARRITRIYVSQKHTAWNGRRNWNIPKHLARFEWTTSPTTPHLTTVKVYPHDTATPYDPSESTPSPTPFFQCTLQPISYTPSFPFKSSWLRFTGFDMSLVQPPVPDASAATKGGELVGSEEVDGGEGRWCRVGDFFQASKKTRLVWVDMRQGEDGGGKGEEVYKNFWPGTGRWLVGVQLEDGVIELGESETWATPRSLL